MLSNLHFYVSTHNGFSNLRKTPTSTQRLINSSRISKTIITSASVTWWSIEWPRFCLWRLGGLGRAKPNTVDIETTFCDLSTIIRIRLGSTMYKDWLQTVPEDHHKYFVYASFQVTDQRCRYTMTTMSTLRKCTLTAHQNTTKHQSCYIYTLGFHSHPGNPHECCSLDGHKHSRLPICVYIDDASDKISYYCHDQSMLFFNNTLLQLIHLTYTCQ